MMLVTAALAGMITKDPGSIYSVHSVVPIGKIAFRAGLDRDNRKQGSDLFIDQMCVMLTRDVSLEGDQLNRYKIGNNVVIYSGATILGGDTHIGDNSVIGGNVWLTHSVPANSTILRN